MSARRKALELHPEVTSKTSRVEGRKGMRVAQGRGVRSSEVCVPPLLPKRPDGEYFQGKLKFIRLARFLRMGSSSLLPGVPDFLDISKSD